MGKSAVTQHATTKKHRKRVPNCEQSIPNESQPESNHHQEETDINIDESIAKAEILWTLLCAEHDLAFLVNDHATNMFKRMFTDSTVAKGYKCGRTKMTYTITHGTYTTFIAELNDKLKNL